MPIIPLARLITIKFPIPLTLFCLITGTLRPLERPRLFDVQGVVISPSLQCLKIRTFPIDAKVWEGALLSLEPSVGCHRSIGVAHEGLDDNVGAVPKMEPLEDKT